MANRTRKRLLTGVGLLGGAAAAAAVARQGERRLATRLRVEDAPEVAARFELPADVERRDLATYDGGSLHVVEKGHGRPLVLVHGVTLGAEVWAPQFNGLADHFRVIAIDVRGHGRSVAGSDGYGRDKAAHDLLTLLTELDLHDAIVVGHSMGGMILGQFCTHHPDALHERVAGLVFMDTAAAQVVPSALGPLAAKAGQQLVARVQSGKPMRAMAMPSDDRGWLMTRMAFGKNPPTAAVDQVARLGAAFPPEASIPSWVDLLDHDAGDGLRKVTTPAMVLVGSRDRLTPVRAAKRIVEVLPHAELHVLDGAGHQLMQERPDEVAELLRDFAAKLPA